MGEFRTQGYLAPAMINFLSLLGWNDGTEQEIFSVEELTTKFSLDRITKSAAVFDKVRGEGGGQAEAGNAGPGGVGGSSVLGAGVGSRACIWCNRCVVSHVSGSLPRPAQEQPASRYHCTARCLALRRPPPLHSPATPRHPPPPPYIHPATPRPPPYIHPPPPSPPYIHPPPPACR